MTTLTYVDGDKTKRLIELPSETGFTVKVISVSVLSGKLEKDVWDKLEKATGRAKAKNLAREGNHALFELFQYDVSRPGSPKPFNLFCIVQSRVPQPEEKQSDSQTWDAFLLHRTAREWIAVADGATRLFVEQKPVQMMKILQHGMQIRMRHLELEFLDITDVLVDGDMIQKLGEDRKCPFCQGSFVVGEKMIKCPSCGTAHHSECWAAYGGRCSGPPGCRYGLLPHGRG